MAVNLTNADNALKSIYLDAISEQLNNKVNPLLAQIKRSSNNVWGKEVRQLAIYGVNGGIAAGTEEGDLPRSSGNNYAQFVVGLKNLYGTIEISDKAIRASENNAGAFVNLLNSEMEGLIKSSAFNFSRMLFGDGSGELAHTFNVQGQTVKLDTVKNVVEGMIIDFRRSAGVEIEGCTARKILAVDRNNKTITVDGGALDTEAMTNGFITLQGSFLNEISGIKKIFSSSELYGLNKSKNPWLNPHKNLSVGDISENIIQKMLDEIEEQSGESVNFIVCSWGVRRALLDLYSSNKRFLDTMEIAGGFKALSFNGIPVVADRFCEDGTMYLLNTNDFTLHQLCDWQWLEGDDGKILKQVAGKPVYTATLVKYAELVCARPYAQGMISGINEK